MSMGFSRQEHWSELPFPSPGDLPNSGLNPRLLHWQGDSLLLSHLGLSRPTIPALRTPKKCPQGSRLRVPSDARVSSLDVMRWREGFWWMTFFHLFYRKNTFLTSYIIWDF